MLKIGTCEELNVIKNTIPKEIYTKCLEFVEILDSEYGSNRNIDTDMGGFVAIIENLKDISLLEVNHSLDLFNDIAENVEVITVKDKDYISILYMLSSDYGITVIANKEILPVEIIERLGV